MKENLLIFGIDFITFFVFFIISIAVVFYKYNYGKTSVYLHEWPPPSNSAQPYVITLVTGYRSGSGTKGRVHLQVKGSEQISSKYEIHGGETIANRVLLDNGHYDSFLIVSNESLGNIEQITISLHTTTETENWFLSYITICDVIGERYFYAPAHRWIEARSTGGQEIDLLVQYGVTYVQLMDNLFRTLREIYIWTCHWSSSVLSSPLDAFFNLSSAFLVFTIIATLTLRFIPIEESSIRMIVVSFLTLFLATGVGLFLQLVYRWMTIKSRSPLSMYYPIMAITEFGLVDTVTNSRFALKPQENILNSTVLLNNSQPDNTNNYNTSAKINREFSKVYFPNWSTYYRDRTTSFQPFWNQNINYDSDLDYNYNNNNNNDQISTDDCDKNLNNNNNINNSFDDARRYNLFNKNKNNNFNEKLKRVSSIPFNLLQKPPGPFHLQPTCSEIHRRKTTATIPITINRFRPSFLQSASRSTNNFTFRKEIDVEREFGINVRFGSASKFKTVSTFSKSYNSFLGNHYANPSTISFENRDSCLLNCSNNNARPLQFKLRDEDDLQQFKTKEVITTNPIRHFIHVDRNVSSFVKETKFQTSFATKPVQTKTHMKVASNPVIHRSTFCKDYLKKEEGFQNILHATGNRSTKKCENKKDKNLNINKIKKMDYTAALRQAVDEIVAKLVEELESKNKVIKNTRSPRRFEIPTNSSTSILLNNINGNINDNHKYLSKDNQKLTSTGKFIHLESNMRRSQVINKLTEDYQAGSLQRKKDTSLVSMQYTDNIVIEPEVTINQSNNIKLSSDSSESDNATSRSKRSTLADSLASVYSQSDAERDENEQISINQAMFMLYDNFRQKLNQELENMKSLSSISAEAAEVLLKETDKEIRDDVLPCIADHISHLVKKDGIDIESIDADADIFSYAGPYIETIITHVILKVQRDAIERCREKRENKDDCNQKELKTEEIRAKSNSTHNFNVNNDNCSQTVDNKSNSSDTQSYPLISSSTLLNMQIDSNKTDDNFIYNDLNLSDDDSDCNSNNNNNDNVYDENNLLHFSHSFLKFALNTRLPNTSNINKEHSCSFKSNKMAKQNIVKAHKFLEPNIFNNLKKYSAPLLQKDSSNIIIKDIEQEGNTNNNNSNDNNTDLVLEDHLCELYNVGLLSNKITSKASKEINVVDKVLNDLPGFKMVLSIFSEFNKQTYAELECGACIDELVEYLVNACLGRSRFSHIVDVICRLAHAYLMKNEKYYFDKNISKGKVQAKMFKCVERQIVSWLVDLKELYFKGKYEDNLDFQYKMQPPNMQIPENELKNQFIKHLFKDVSKMIDIMEVFVGEDSRNFCNHGNNLNNSSHPSIDPTTNDLLQMWPRDESWKVQLFRYARWLLLFVVHFTICMCHLSIVSLGLKLDFSEAVRWLIYFGTNIFFQILLFEFSKLVFFAIIFTLVAKTLFL